MNELQTDSTYSLWLYPENSNLAVDNYGVLTYGFCDIKSIVLKIGMFKTPIRQHSKPTCAFYRNRKGDLIFKDFRGDFYGNFISVVMYKFDCPYGKALQIIANDFGIVSRKNLTINKPLIKYTNQKFNDTTQAVIQIEDKS